MPILSIKAQRKIIFSQSESLFFYSLFSFIFKIPKGHVWLLGDNPNYSKDSRDYGPVPYGLIRGRACFKVRLHVAL